MSGPDCQQVQPLLSAFVGDECSTTERARVGLHLRHCAACRRRAADEQPAPKALREWATGAAAAIEPPFAAMHAEIMAQTVHGPDAYGGTPLGSGAQRVDVQPVRRPLRGPLFATAAALLLGAIGFWLAAERPAPSVWNRPATALPVHDLRAVPYAGPRLQLRPIGLDRRRAPDGTEQGFGQCMMGRESLRTLVDEQFPLLPQPRR